MKPFQRYIDNANFCMSTQTQAPSNSKGLTPRLTHELSHYFLKKQQPTNFQMLIIFLPLKFDFILFLLLLLHFFKKQGTLLWNFIEKQYSILKMTIPKHYLHPSVFAVEKCNNNMNNTPKQLNASIQITYLLAGPHLPSINPIQAGLNRALCHTQKLPPWTLAFWTYSPT